MSISPKNESQKVGFYYTVTPEQIRDHQKKSLDEIIMWVESTAKFIYDMQTPEERERIKKAKNFTW